MKAVIDLDWLDSEIDQTNQIYNSLDGEESQLEYNIVFSKLKILQTIRDSCNPIEQQTINGYVVTKGEWTNATIEDQKVTEFLSKTCINDWESNQYCSNQNKCQMCKIKQ